MLTTDELNNIVETPEPATEETNATAPEMTKETPMILKRIQKNAENGTLDVTLNLSLEQTYVLLQFAIMFLMSQGLAMFSPPANEEKEEATADKIVLGTQLH